MLLLTAVRTAVVARKDSGPGIDNDETGSTPCRIMALEKEDRREECLPWPLTGSHLQHYRRHHFLVLSEV